MANNNSSASAAKSTETSAADHAATAQAEQAAAPAPTPPAEPKAAAKTPTPAPEAEADVAAVKATLRIDGAIEAGTLFVPASDAQRAELFGLGAVEELSETESIVAATVTLPSYAKLTAQVNADKAARIQEAQRKEMASKFVENAVLAAAQAAAVAKQDADF